MFGASSFPRREVAIVDEEAKKWRSMEQLEDNLGVTVVEITEEDRERLDEVAPPGRATVAYYEADIGPHRFCW